MSFYKKEEHKINNYLKYFDLIILLHTEGKTY